MDGYKVVKYTSGFYKQWNNFIEEAKNATFLFHRDFMEYHQNRFEDASLMVFKKDKLVALLPANKIGDKVFSHQGLTYGGLVFSKNLKFSGVLECFKVVLEFLQRQKIKTLDVGMLPTMYSSLPNDEMQYLMFLLNAQHLKRDSLSVVNQKQPIDLSKNRKEGLKRGQKFNLTIREDDIFDDFWNKILIPNLLQKHGANPVHSLSEIKLLKSRFPNNIKQYNVYFENKLVAGTTIFITDHVVHSQYISADEDKNKLGSLDFLHVHLLQKVFVDKMYFDFGNSNENKGKQVNKGLQYWKEGFGARTIIQDFYRINTANHELLNHVFI
ncbi:MAG: GNAT family N-acetyltransferase [Aestuariibaculum sp.]